MEEKKKEILESCGIDFDSFELENEFSAKSIRKAMDIYSGEFAEWCSDRGWEYFKSWKAWQNRNFYDTNTVATTSELLEIFRSGKENLND